MSYVMLYNMLSYVLQHISCYVIYIKYVMLCNINYVISHKTCYVI